MSDILHDLLAYFVGAAIAYILGWIHGTSWFKRFVERKANVKIIDTSTVTIVPKEPEEPKRARGMCLVNERDVCRPPHPPKRAKQHGKPKPCPPTVKP